MPVRVYISLLVGALFGSVASASEVVLLPAVVAIEEGDEDAAGDLRDALVRVLRADDFVVLEPPDVRPVLGEALEVCPPAQRTGCVSVGLMSIPARVAIVVRVERGVGAPAAVVDFVHQGDAEPIRSLRLSLGVGEEERVAVQVALGALDVFEQVGASSPAMVEAARRMTQLGSSSYGGIVRGIVPLSEEPDDEEGPLDAAPFEEEALDAEVDVMLDRLDAQAPEVDELAPRLFAGARRDYEAREGDVTAWLKLRRPHAGRFLIELRGLLSYGDVKRQLLTMGALDEDQALTAVLWEEGPVQGLSGGLELSLGYAPTTYLEFGVIGGVRFVYDEGAIGYMNEGSTPSFGEMTPFFVPRPYVQPRLRVYPVHLGVAKPFVLLGGRFEFVKNWRFNTGTAQPFARPPGGVLYGLQGGVGVVIEATPRVGVVVESSMTYHIGQLAKVRVAGTLVGDAPLPPVGEGWGLDVALGLQFRL